MAFVLRGGRIWDGTGDEAREGSLAVDGRIAGLDGRSGESIDISGCTVVPGLIEAHAHLCFNGASDWRQVYDADSPTTMALRMAGHRQYLGHVRPDGHGIALVDAGIEAWNRLTAHIQAHHPASGRLLQGQVTANVIGMMMGIEDMRQTPPPALQRHHDGFGLGRIDRSSHAGIRVVNQVNVIVAQGGYLQDLHGGSD